MSNANNNNILLNAVVANTTSGSLDTFGKRSYTLVIKSADTGVFTHRINMELPDGTAAPPVRQIDERAIAGDGHTIIQWEGAFAAIQCQVLNYVSGTITAWLIVA